MNLLSSSVSKELVNTIQYATTVINDERGEFGENELCADIVLDWLVITGDAKPDKQKPNKYLLEDPEFSGSLMVEDGIPIYVSSDVVDVKLGPLLSDVILAHTRVHRVKYPDYECSDGWVKLRVLIDLIESGRVNVTLKKGTLKVWLSKDYKLEVEELIAIQ